jgi:hypothetical protein
MGREKSLREFSQEIDKENEVLVSKLREFFQCESDFPAHFFEPVIEALEGVLRGDDVKVTSTRHVHVPPSNPNFPFSR